MAMFRKCDRVGCGELGESLVGYDLPVGWGKATLVDHRGGGEHTFHFCAVCCELFKRWILTESAS